MSCCISTKRYSLNVAAEILALQSNGFRYVAGLDPFTGQTQWSKLRESQASRQLQGAVLVRVATEGSRARRE